MAKKFLFRGKEEEDLKKLSISEFAELIDSRLRRKVKRGFTEIEKKLIERVEKRDQNIKVQCRDMIILPSMIGLTMKIHNGKEWNPVIIIPDMLGHRFGEFSMTRKQVRHSAAGIGATKSSSSMSVK